MDPEKRDEIFVAIGRGDEEPVGTYLHEGGDPNLSRHGMPALVYAAQCGELRLLELLLDAGADLEIKTWSGWTALHKAANNGHLDVVQALLCRGADAAARTDEGETALDLAELAGEAAVAQALRAPAAAPAHTPAPEPAAPLSAQPRGRKGEHVRLATHACDALNAVADVVRTFKTTTSPSRKRPIQPVNPDDPPIGSNAKKPRRFVEGDTAWVPSHGKLWKVKILKVDLPSSQYFVHFYGWSKSHDTNVPESDLRESTHPEVVEQQEAEKQREKEEEDRTKREEKRQRDEYKVKYRITPAPTNPSPQLWNRMERSEISGGMSSHSVDQRQLDGLQDAVAIDQADEDASMTLSDDMKTTLRAILYALEGKTPFYEPFSKPIPVDHHDYHQLVHQPMDFQTITEKVEVSLMPVHVSLLHPLVVSADVLLTWCMCAELNLHARASVHL